jgi:peptidylprolyl isomerase
MNHRTLVSALGFSAALITGCNSSDTSNQPTATAEEKLERSAVSEAFGYYLYEGIKVNPIDFDDAAVVRGIQKSMDGAEAPLSREELTAAMTTLQQEAIARLTVENLEAANAFLTENSTKPGVLSSEDGKVQWLVLAEGAGEPVTEDDVPTVHYEGSLIDGTVFDSSHRRGTPAVMPLQNIIPGFRTGVVGMKEGERRKLFIHPDYAYGTQGQLPPNSLLIFEVELLKRDIPDDGEPIEAEG